MKRRHFLRLATPLGLGALHMNGWAQGPTQAVRMQVGATPGGGTDIVARALAQAMEAELRRSVVVENKPGAGGNIAASAVAQASGDPNLLLLAYTSHAINPAIGIKQNFDPLKDFTPLSLVATSPLLLVCHPDLPVKSTGELIAYARRNPGKLSIAGAGLGSASQLSGEMLKAQARLDIVSVPYKGAAPAVQDMLGGQVQLMLSNVATVRPFLESRKLKALGVSTKERLAAYPEAAPIAQVLPDFDFRTWYGVLAPQGLKAEDAKTLEQVAIKAGRSDLVKQRLEHEGLEPVGNSSAQFKAFIDAELKRWAAVAKATGVRVS
ncbi:tripartite tricarboxylate transporter substrate binding protein [Variovorax defluvii]|uniref:Bug family tripartite tricarboxylate transporter substrate binding protein n=1 Tax=Variovorax defluvii TaxID=913761 RepID=UPI0031F123A4